MLNRTALFKLALDSLYFSGLYHLLKNRFSGVGVLLTLHHVAPAGPVQNFSPNRILDITPEFLEATILQIRELGCDIVSLDEFRRRLTEADFGKRFVAITLDDGYADNYRHAYPIFKRNQVPFTIYLCTGLMAGGIDLWWQVLQDVIQEEERIEVVLDGKSQVFATTNTVEKYRTYETIYWALRRMPLVEQLDTFTTLRDRYSHSNATSAAVALSWDMVAEMQRSKLLTIGAHTVNHFAMSKLTPEQARSEITASQDLIKERTGVEPVHFAYPYGDVGSAASREFEIVKELGFATAVTTRKGVVFAEHAQHLTALPRVSLNGDYQQERNVNLFMSGLPFALANGFRRVNVG